jgi:hypothetical protein
MNLRRNSEEIQISSRTILYYVQRWTDVHFLLYGGIGIFTCVTLGYLASLLFPSPKPCPNNLTL